MEAIHDCEMTVIDDPCSCNQPDEARIAVHQRGHHGFCRDTNELGGTPAAE